MKAVSKMFVGGQLYLYDRRKYARVKTPRSDSVVSEVLHK
jgi:hypothetical protein